MGKNNKKPASYNITTISWVALYACILYPFIFKKMPADILI